MQESIHQLDLQLQQYVPNKRRVQYLSDRIAEMKGSMSCIPSVSKPRINAGKVSAHYTEDRISITLGEIQEMEQEIQSLTFQIHKMDEMMEQLVGVDSAFITDLYINGMSTSQLSRIRCESSMTTYRAKYRILAKMLKTKR